MTQRKGKTGRGANFVKLMHEADLGKIMLPGPLIRASGK
jgi:hypothetical protein